MYFLRVYNLKKKLMLVEASSWLLEASSSWLMCLSAKILDIFYLMFISTHMVLKEKFDVCMPLHFDFFKGSLSMVI